MKIVVCVLQVGRDLVLKEFVYSKKLNQFDLQDLILFHFQEICDVKTDDCICFNENYFEEESDDVELKEWFYK